MTTESIIEIIGWLGVIFYVFAYLLLSVGRVSAKSYLFHLLNMCGAICLITDSAYYGDKPNLAVNVIWLIIGAFVVTRKFVSSLKG